MTGDNGVAPMKTSKFRSTILRAVSVALSAAVSIAACNSEGPPRGELTASTSSAVFTNGGFETGTGGQPPPAPWTVNSFINDGITVQTPQTIAGLDLQNGGVANTVILSAGGAGPGSQNDQAIGSLLKWPRYGQNCALVNGPNTRRTPRAPTRTSTS